MTKRTVEITYTIPVKVSVIKVVDENQEDEDIIEEFVDSSILLEDIMVKGGAEIKNPYNLQSVIPDDKDAYLTPLDYYLVDQDHQPTVEWLAGDWWEGL